MPDYLSITEVPGAPVNREQLGRMVLRYSLAAALADGRPTLEVGCGAGIGLGLLLDRAAPLVACDGSFGAVSLARQSLGHAVPLAQADAHYLPYREDTFDFIFSFEMIYYLARPIQFLGECHRLLTRGGQILVGTSNPDWPFFVPGQLSVHYPTAPELVSWLRAAGFESIHLYGSLPVDQMGRRFHTVLVAWLRRHLLRLGILAQDNRLTRLLKRLSYGHLTPLPRQLSRTMGVAAPFRELTAIDPGQRDRRHRVLFVLGRARKNHT
ncbi:methyltransferase domain-containing protein [Litorilinea aerophila]|nr:class I SAM-dependent methyltransferase [Litorilinea aerophila]MCC9077639.1 methyltransferase domain-containing protein [Litorilinea aerophila]